MHKLWQYWLIHYRALYECMVPMVVLGVHLTQTKSTRSPYRLLIVQRPHNPLHRLPLFVQLKKQKHKKGKFLAQSTHATTLQHTIKYNGLG